MGQLNQLNDSMSTAALLQLKQEATNRYSQVQGALMNEKTRQLAVFKAKQDERKQRKIEFKSTRLKTVSDKLKELNALRQAGQKCWNNQKQVLSDIDKSQQ